MFLLVELHRVIEEVDERRDRHQPASAAPGPAAYRVACAATTMPDAVFLGLGSNLGEREQTLARALDALQARGFRLTRASSLYLTEPVGGPPQDWYVNQVVAGLTPHAPEA